MKNPHHILITGASSGIGEALALFYAQKGNTLFLCAQNMERLGNVAGRCRDKGAEVFMEKVDVADADLLHSVKPYKLQVKVIVGKGST